MLVVCYMDTADGLVSVRSRSDGELGQMTIEEFVNRAVEEVKNKTNK